MLFYSRYGTEDTDWHNVFAGINRHKDYDPAYPEGYIPANRQLQLTDDSKKWIDTHLCPCAKWADENRKKDGRKRFCKFRIDERNMELLGVTFKTSYVSKKDDNGIRVKDENGKYTWVLEEQSPMTFTDI